MRLYSLKFYNDAVSPRELIHDFVPAQRVSDKIYGLYDLVAERWCPNGSATPFLAGPVMNDHRLALSSLHYSKWALAATVTRIGRTGATDVYAAWGATYAGVDAAAWEHTAKCGEFAENVLEAKFSTPSFSRDTVYVRFYTADGEWSETVYLPDQTLIPSGLVIYLR